MIENIGLFEKGDEGALNMVYQNMLGYAELLQNHIYKENNILFRMADSNFSEDDQKVLLEKFSNIEAIADEGGKVEDFVAAIEELAKVYL